MTASFDAYNEQVYSWAYRVLGHHHDAQDVVQEVFLKWRLQCAREVPARPHGWLRRVTLNRALDEGRKRRPRLLARLPERVGTARRDPLEQAELREDVARGLAGLSPMQREVVVARSIDGLSFEQTAVQLGISSSTAKTHFLRGLLALRRRLAPRWSVGGERDGL